MTFLVQLAILVVTTLIARALAPKPPKQKPPSLDDFDIPTAEEGRPLPVVFGSVTITGANVCWYGDYEVKTKTKDGVKTRQYYMGLHFGLCHGPIDVFREIICGGKTAWTGRVLQSGTITITASNLFGGREEGGGIAGDLDIMMGEATQTANTYLSGIQGTPQPAYRGMLSAVLNKGLIGANSTYVAPWAFRVKRTKKGWYNDACWYPDTAEVGEGGEEVGDATGVHSLITALSPGLYFRFDTFNMSAGASCSNSGSAPVNGTYRGNCQNVDPIMVANSWYQGQSVYLNSAGYIDVPSDYDFNYFDHNVISIGFMIRTPSDPTWSSYGGGGMIYLHGDKGVFNQQGVSITFDNFGGKLVLDYATIAGWKSATVTLTDPVGPDEVACIGIVFSRVGGANGKGYMTVYKNCTLQGTADLPDYAVPSTNQPLVIGASKDLINYSEYLYATLEYFFIVADEVSAEEWSDIADAAAVCGGGGYPHMNPAHIIYQAITDPAWGMGLPAAMIDETNFAAAADTFFNEGLGLSFQWLRQEPIENLIQIVCDHAGAIFTQDPSTGKFILIPLRADYTVANLPTFDTSNCRLEKFERAGYGELVGEINVVYRDWETNTDAATPPQQNLATIQSQLGVVYETIQYPAIPTMALANRIAARDLAARSVPLARGVIKCNREAWDLTPGACFRLTWSPLGITQMVCRVASISSGKLTDGVITVDWVEDVFGLSDTVYAAEQTTGWAEPTTDPAAAAAQTAIELPYAWLAGSIDRFALDNMPATVGYGAILGASPATVSDGYEVWASLNSGAYAKVNSETEWPESTTLEADAARSATTITLAAAFDDVEAGDLLMIGSGVTAEIVRVTVVSGTTLTVDRGIYDTTPQAHSSGARVWALPAFALQDETAYTDGDVVDYKPLTITRTGTYFIADATASSVTMDVRQIRPYAPGNIEINGEPFPTALEGVLTVTWSDRDRVSLGTVIVTQDDVANYGPEAGTTYNGYAYDDDTDTLLDSQTGIGGSPTSWTPTIVGSCNLRIEIEAERDGYASWQRQVRVFAYTAITG